MEQKRWTVVALQWDLLDSNPAVSVQDSVSGETLTVDPYRVLDIGFDADKKTIWGAGYIQGYNDRHFERGFRAAFLV